MHLMQMYHDMMAVPPLSALAICQARLKLATYHGDLHWNRLVMSHLRNASHNVCSVQCISYIYIHMIIVC